MARWTPPGATVQPIKVAEGVRTVGELELIEHLEKGLPVADSRKGDSYDRATIPGPVNPPFADAAARRGELDREHPTVSCNGPSAGGHQGPSGLSSKLATPRGRSGTTEGIVNLFG